MKVLSSLLALALVGALSVWLWVGQTPSETVAEGVSVTFDSAPQAPQQEPPAQATGYAAALLGLRTALDLSLAPGVLDDPDRLSDAIQDAKSAVGDKAEAREAEERRKAEEEHAKEAEKRAKDAEKSAQPVSPPPVSPPSYNCEWDDDEWDCDDDDDDDDWDDWDDR